MARGEGHRLTAGSGRDAEYIARRHTQSAIGTGDGFDSSPTIRKGRTMKFTDRPRVELVGPATPLHSLPALSEELGIDLSVKRDDLAGGPFGGNKSRQLEFHLGEARERQADTILISGAVQSNFVRTAAAAARSLGMKPIVQLEDRVPGMDDTYRSSGNVLLLRILGAEIMRHPDGEDEAGADAVLRDRATSLRNEGKRPYVIPLAPENQPIGALGYVAAGQEILAQAGEFDIVVVPSGSGITHTGLLAGLRLAGSRARVVGSCVRRPAQLQFNRLLTVLEGLSPLLGNVSVGDPAAVHLWDGALAPGYGRIGPLVTEAMRMMARREGILLDPVYSAKAFAAIPALVASGGIPRDSRVLFVHTGGLAAIFGYRTALEEAF